MTRRESEILLSSSTDISKAVAILKRGGLIAFPTETVYGLGADATNSDAVSDIYAAKGRPSFNPLIVHVADIATAETLVNFSDIARILADKFWPGPLTLVLPIRDNSNIANGVTAGLKTLAIRVPQNEVAQDLLHQFNGPIAAPSANASGRLSPTSAQHVFNDLTGKIDAVIDGGASTVGLESTILMVDQLGVTVLRDGGLTREDISKVIGDLQDSQDDQNAPKSPGQLLSHYAPHASIRLNAASAKTTELMIGFGVISGDLNLSKTADLKEAAKNLFAVLHNADQTCSAEEFKSIAIAPIPNTGLGRAINDRLARAAL